MEYDVSLVMSTTMTMTHNSICVDFDVDWKYGTASGWLWIVFRTVGTCVNIGVCFEFEGVIIAWCLTEYETFHVISKSITMTMTHGCALVLGLIEYICVERCRLWTIREYVNI